MIAAAATAGDVLIKNVIPKHLEAISAKLIEVGCRIEEYDEAVRVIGKEKLVHTNIKTLPYPGFRQICSRGHSIACQMRGHKYRYRE